MGQLDGKVALVTGGARGTGEAIVRLFVSEGAQVAILDILDERARAVAGELGKDCRFWHCDVTKPEDWRAAVDAVMADFGQIDVLVNDAAILHLGRLEETTPEDFQRILEVNVLGVFLGIQAVVEPMRRSGGGSIVNISSVDASHPSQLTLAYSASKYALEGIMRVAAMELRPDAIRVNNILAGFGNPEMIRDALGPFKPGADYLDSRGDNLSLMQAGARVALFLASDSSGIMSGANVTADQGRTAGDWGAV